MWQRTEPKEKALGSLNLCDRCYCEVAGPDGTGTKNEDMLCTIHKVTKPLRELQQELAQTKRGGQAAHLAKTITDFDFLD